MFGKFGGIVIIALSVVIVAGLILRSVPEHPAALSLGITDNNSPTQKPTVKDTTATTEATAETVKEGIDETTKAASDTLEAAKGIAADKAEDMKSKTVEAIKETVTDTVESADEVVGVIKETVETKSE